MESMYMESGVRTALSDILHELEYGAKKEAIDMLRKLLRNPDEEEVEDDQ